MQGRPKTEIAGRIFTNLLEVQINNQALNE